jgi:hypothetical protein
MVMTNKEHKKKGFNYSSTEVNHLLEIISKHLPIDQDEWQAVVNEHIL